MATKTLGNHYVSIGVIGHIDHGKTTLVGKLTGTETDTQPEEKRRGITIDLGFACMTLDEYTFAFIDAPGHQKYVGNLLAGVSAVDIGLLVVACDQGIQEQTLEHVAILSKLGVPQLIVALARIDLCDLSRQHELTEELRVFLEDFGFRNFPVVALSSVTGEGLDELKHELRVAADRTHSHPHADQSLASQSNEGSSLAKTDFRMPIDRVLHVEGRGLVVAGTIWHGLVRLGDQLTIAGRDQEFRVREIEIHGKSVDQSTVGVRTALNLAGPQNEGVARGDELVTPGSYPMTKRMLVSLSMFPDAKPLRLPITAQMHLATNAVNARLLGGKSSTPNGEATVVIVETENPIVAEFEQQCLFRSPYPVGSFAGGKIIARLDDIPGMRRRISNSAWIEMGQALVGESFKQRLLIWIKQLGELQLNADWLRRQLGIVSEDLSQTFASIQQTGEVVRVGDLLVTEERLGAVATYLMKSMTARAESSDDAWWAIDSVVEHAAHLASAEVIHAVIRRLIEESQLVELNRMLAVASEKTRLSKKQRAKMDNMLQLYADAKTPPTLKEVCEQLSLTKDAAQSLLRHATQQRLLTDLSNGLYIASEVFNTMVADLATHFETAGQLTVPQIKDIWGVTRKHVIPLLEYCDQQQLTQRQGDVRVAGKRLEVFVQEVAGDHKP